MTSNFIAVDLGASGTKIIRGSFNGKLLEINKIGHVNSFHYEKNNLSWWDFSKIYDSVMKVVDKTIKHYDVESVGFDSWGVDFGLLDKKGNLINDPLQYRTMFKVKDHIVKVINENRDYISERIPTQFQPFNTVYQLLLYKSLYEELLKKADKILSIPSLFAYKLTGKKYYEFTQATTTQLYNYRAKKWDYELIKTLGIPKIFPEVVPPGTVLNGYKEYKVVLPASHDTGSAFTSVSAKSNQVMIISLGTWCLNGVVISKLPKTQEILKYNYAIEGCADGRLRVIANTTGLWLFQKLKEQWDSIDKPVTYEKLVKMAEVAPSFSGYIDVDKEIFQKTKQMDYEIANESKKLSGKEPQTKNEIARIALEGIALKIRKTKEDLEKLFGYRLNKIRIVGGGINNKLLCQMIANATNLPVIAGPADGTAIGNLLLQLLALNFVPSFKQGYELLKNSFELIEYRPSNAYMWDKAFSDFIKVLYYK
ncbi:MAG: FGGY family carbohydrate kinase [Kosmotogaceae bacterium]